MPDPSADRNHALKLLALFLVAGYAIFLRSYNAFAVPILHCEDGRDLLGHYFNHGSPSEILRFYAGYVSLLPNLVGYLSARAPLPAVPHLFAGYSLIVAALAHSVFYLRRFRELVPSDAARFLVCLLLVALPAGNFAVFSTATYTLWHLLFLLLLLAFAPPPRSAAGRGVQFAFMGLAIWSHPLSALALPLLLRGFLRARDRGERLFAAGLAAVVVAYFAVGVRPAEASPAPLLASIARTPAFLSERVVFESLFGNRLRVWLHASGRLPIVHLCSALVVALLLLLAVRRFRTLARTQRAGVLVAVAFVVAITVVTVSGRDLDPGPAVVYGQRYFYLQQLLFLTLAATAVGGLLARRRPGRPAIAAVAAAAVLWVAALNVSNLAYFRTSASVGRHTADFLHHVERRIATGEAEPGEEFVLQRGRGWSIRLRAP